MFRRYNLMIIFLITLVVVGCSVGEANSDIDMTYDEMINDVREVYENEEDEVNSDKDYMYGDDFELNSDIDIYKDGKYLKLTLYNAGYDYHGDKSIIYFEFVNDGYSYLNRTSEHTSDEIDRMKSDYSLRNGKEL